MNDKEQRRKNWDEKKQARLERYRARAETSRKKAEGHSERASDILSFIPAGQPILVGHHSERRHRRDIERIDSNIGKSVEYTKKADYYESKVEAIESNTAIQSDDPDAIDKLENKVENLEKIRDEMKRVNAAYKKAKGDLSKVEMSESIKERVLKNLRIWGKSQPFPAYELTNLGARIRTAKKRTEVIAKAGDFKGFEVGGITVELNDGQIQVAFPYKPNEETRTKLKTYPISLKWSGYSKKWVRKYTGQGECYAEQLKKVLESAGE